MKLVPREIIFPEGTSMEVRITMRYSLRTCWFSPDEGGYVGTDEDDVMHHFDLRGDERLETIKSEIIFDTSNGHAEEDMLDVSGLKRAKVYWKRTGNTFDAIIDQKKHLLFWDSVALEAMDQLGIEFIGGRDVE